MEAYCVFLMGSFIALPRFAKRYGNYNSHEDKYFIAASWQSAFQCGGPVGAFIGCFIAGPITSKIGYRWTTIGALMLLNAFILVFYFGDSLGVLLASQLLEGIPWGIFIANAPAYCSEIVPMRLRAPATQMLQWFWAIGAIIVGGVCYAYQGVDEDIAYRYVTCDTFDSFVANKTESQSRSSGCSQLRLPFSSGGAPSRPGGSFERASLREQRRLSSAWVAQRPKSTPRTLWK